MWWFLLWERPVLSLLKPFLLRFTGPWRKFERNWNRTLPWKTLPTWRMSDSIWYFRKSLQGLTCQIYPYYASKWPWYMYSIQSYRTYIYMYIIYKFEWNTYIKYPTYIQLFLSGIIQVLTHGRRCRSLHLEPQAPVKCLRISEIFVVRSWTESITLR